MGECAQCGSGFEPKTYRGRQKFCGPDCRRRAEAVRRKKARSTPEWRAKHREYVRKYNASPENRARLKASRDRLRNDPAYKERVRAASRRRYKRLKESWAADPAAHEAYLAKRRQAKKAGG